MRENKNFLLLLIAVSLPFGTQQAVQILISNLFEPFGYTSSEIAFIAVKLIIVGVVGAIIMGALVDRTHKYKLTMHLITISATIAILLVIAALTFRRENKDLFISLMMLYGFCYMGFIPLCLSYGAELTFPLQPALVNGTITLAGSASGFVFSLVGAFITLKGSDDDLLS